MESKEIGEKSKMFAEFSRTKADDIQEAKELIQAYFYKGTIQTRIREAQFFFAKIRRKTGANVWGDNRVAEIFTGKTTRINGYELDVLRAMKRARQLAEARREYAAVNDDIARLEAMLSHTDEAFHGEAVAALGKVRRSLAGTGTEGAGE